MIPGPFAHPPLVVFRWRSRLSPPLRASLMAAITDEKGTALGMHSVSSIGAALIRSLIAFSIVHAPPLWAGSPRMSFLRPAACLMAFVITTTAIDFLPRRESVERLLVLSRAIALFMPSGEIHWFRSLQMSSLVTASSDGSQFRSLCSPWSRHSTDPHRPRDQPDPTTISVHSDECRRRPERQALQTAIAQTRRWRKGT